ncbi:MAG: glycosyl transferase family 2 [Bacteroidetes bacterium HGW-Bacteroidetes-16]|nr:MAG: glycosyl transferase family 2 [Bacteroidetes bacterium HGW-Bacteroidetes-16]
MGTILVIIQIVLFIYVTGTILMLLLFSFASLFTYNPPKAKDQVLRKFVVLIPAYQEDEVIMEVVTDALKQQYPSEKFDVVVIADKFRPETIQLLKMTKAIVLAKDFEISTKSRALKYAFEQLTGDYDVACILDADNLMTPDFLQKLNAAFSNGFIAVQGHRVAKNTNTNFAILDAISEEINNHIFRYGQRVLGFSSTLIGSAMAFDFSFFKEMIAEVEVVGGFDKEIEMRIFSKKLIIEYLPDALVYDEKVQNAQVFGKQRRRWLSAQFHFFGKNLLPSFKMMVSENNYEYFFKSLQYMQLPRILLLGLLFFLTFISWIFNFYPWNLLWTFDFVLLILVFAFAIPGKFYTFRTLNAMWALPIGFMSMVGSLLRMHKANERFIHTKHTYNAFQIKKKRK